MVANQRTISQFVAAPGKGLVDGVDAIHSGVIKGLESFAYNRCIIEHAGFAIANGTGSLNVMTLSNPFKYVFDGKMTTVAADKTISTVAAHASLGRYDWVVLNTDDNSLSLIQGTAHATPQVGDFNSAATNFDRYIPIALVYMAGGSAVDAARTFQMYTLDKNSLSLSVADDGASALTIVEAMSITSASGVTTFENKVSDADVIFKVNDGGVSTEVLRLDASKSQVSIGGETNSEATLHVRNSHTTHGLLVESTEAGAGSAPDITFYRNSTSPADGDDLGIILFRGRNDNSQSIDYTSIVSEIDDASDGAEGGQIRFKVYSAGTNTTWLDVNTGTSGAGLINFNPSGVATLDFKVESDSYDVISVDASDNHISIGGNDSAKIGFYAASPIVTPVLDAAVMTASAGTAETDAKVMAVATTLVNLGLVNIA